MPAQARILIPRSGRPHSLGHKQCSGPNGVFDFQHFNMAVNKGVIKAILVGFVNQPALVDTGGGIRILRPGVVHLVKQVRSCRFRPAAKGIPAVARQLLAAGVFAQ